MKVQKHSKHLIDEPYEITIAKKDEEIACLQSKIGILTRDLLESYTKSSELNNLAKSLIKFINDNR